MFMDYNFEIIFKREGYWNQPIHVLYFKSEDNPDCITNLKECYGEDLVSFLKQVLSLFRESSNNDTLEEILKFDDKQLRKKIEELLLENSQMKSINKNLEDKFLQLSESKANQELVQLENEIKQLKDKLKNADSWISQLNDQLFSEKRQYQKNITDYNTLYSRWIQLFPQFPKLDDLANHVFYLKQENEKKKKSNERLEKQVPELEKQLQETQQKLLVATNRLRGLNVNANLAGGGSRSDKLRNEFSYLKSGLFHEVSSKVLSDWRNKDSKLTTRSEEFFKIKSILSKRVFCGGMAYFAKDKDEIDAELNLMMDVLSEIEDFRLTPVVFQKVQERIQAGLLRSKGVDNSDQALIKYADEVTKLIDQDLEQIVNLKTTGEALSEILKFAESGLRLVRDIVTDPNSGELFMPENESTFDDISHETRGEYKDQIKMTICAGYRVAGNVLVKADVITYEPESISKKNELTSLNSSDSQNPKEESEQQNSDSIEDKTTKIEEYGDPKESPSQEATPNESNPSQNNQDISGQQRSLIIFKGKVKNNSGLNRRSYPRRNSVASLRVEYATELDFEGWIVGEPWDNAHKNSGSRWYKLAGENFWLPSLYIEGEPPSDLPSMTIEGCGDEPK